MGNILTLISGYYPDYGFDTQNFHIFINLLALRGKKPGTKGEILKNNYKKMIKNLLIGYDIDVLFLVRYGFPMLLNAFEAYETDQYFKLYGKFENFNNKFIESYKGKTKIKASFDRSQLIYHNIMNSNYQVKGKVNTRMN